MRTTGLLSLPLASLLALPCRANVAAPAALPQAAPALAPAKTGLSAPPSAPAQAAPGQAAAAPAHPAAPAEAKPPQAKPSKDTAKAAKLARQAALALRKLRYGKAIALLRAALAADPDSAQLYSRLGDAQYRKAFRAGPEKAERKSAAAAVAAYEKALALGKGRPSPYTLYHGLALCYEAVQKPASALEAWKKAAAASPSNPIPYLQAASLRYRLGESDLSASNLASGLRRARKINAYPAVARLIRGDPAYSGLLASPGNRALLDMYDAVHAGKLDEAEALRTPGDLRDSLRDVPPQALPEPPAVLELDARVGQRLSEADYAFQQQKYRAAIEAYKEALAADKRKGTLEGARRSLVYERIGSAYRQLGLVGEAVRFLEKALAQMPQNSSAHFQLSLSYAAGGKLGRALASLEDALQNAATPADLRTLALSARAEPDFQALRTLPEFAEVLSAHSQKLSAKR